MNKVKFYKDPRRAQQTSYVPYVPQYKVHGYEPMQIESATVPLVHQQQMPITQKDHTNRNAPVVSRQKQKPIAMVRSNVPFATVPSEPAPLGTGPMLNVGNNIETGWASVDDTLFDELGDEDNNSLDPNHPMIDNNDDDPVNYQHIPRQIKSAPQPTMIEEDLEVTEQSQDIFNIPNDQYVLIVAGSVLGVGTIDAVQTEVRKLVFGEHDLCKTLDITEDDIIVLKRVQVKIGVFIE